MLTTVNLPPQQLPFSKKNKEWRKKHLDWADSKTFTDNSLVRKSVIHKKINYDLLNGRLHMQDLELILNPESIKAGYVPDRIQHYPIMNSNLMNNFSNSMNFMPNIEKIQYFNNCNNNFMNNNYM